MRIIICGAGVVGYNLAAYLAKQNNDITVIDRSESLIEAVNTSLDVRAIVGMASHPDVLEAAGASECDIIIAVTQIDEVNMIACQVAHSLFNIPKKIARVRERVFMQPQWADMFASDELPIDVVIAPEYEVALSIHNQISVPGSFDHVPLFDNRLFALGIYIQEDCPIIRTQLRQLKQIFPHLNIQIMAINRGQELISPYGDEMLLEGDEIYCCVPKEELERTLSAFGIEKRDISSMIIAGASNIGYYLAKGLSDHKSETHHQNMRINMIDPNRENAVKIAESLYDVTMFNGDILDREILFEAGIRDIDAFIAVSDKDEVNILSAGLARHLGAKYVIALASKLSYEKMGDHLFIDSLIHSRDITISKILHHVRYGAIQQVHVMFGGRCEMIDADIIDGCSLCGAMLNDKSLGKIFWLGAILRDDELLTLRPDMALQAGDRIIACVPHGQIKKFEQIISDKSYY